MLNRIVSSPRAWIFVGLLAALAFVLWRHARGPLVQADPVVRSDIIQTVVSTGRLITPARVELGSVVTGTVKVLLAREGETVKRGQVIARLEDDELRAALAQAQASAIEAGARLAQLASLAAPVAENALHRAEQNLRLAREEHARTESLHRQGFFSTARLDEATRNLKVAEADVSTAGAQAAANRPRGSEYALAEARRVQAEAAVRLARARLDYAAIRASADGTLLRKFVETGDTVQPGKKLFELTVAGETQVTLLVDEKNIGLVTVGQQARVAADAYPDRPVNAEVFYVAPAIDPARGTVEVKLRILKPEGFLRPDMTVSAELLAGKRERVLALPAGSVRDVAGAAPWVLAVRDGRATRVPVKLGLRGEGVVEVVGGLAEGELVVPARAPVQDGARLRAEAAPSPALAKPGASGSAR